jgi:hypothetical protein
MSFEELAELDADERDRIVDFSVYGKNEVSKHRRLEI